MRVLIAPDKFKGSMPAGVVAFALEDVVERLGHEVISLPIADGGEGTSRVLCQALGGTMVEAEVLDPLGRPVTAGYASAGVVAVIEMSEASGLWRIDEKERDPWRASTFGTGQLIRDAVENHHAEQFVLGIGGSATNDGGCGMARALGYRFLDAKGAEVTDLPAELERVESIDRSGVIALPAIEVACDVDNPLLGESGATRIYGPQKGIADSDFERHERRLQHLVKLVSEWVPDGLATRPGAGAAGGLGFGMLAFGGAGLKPGFDLVAEMLDLEDAIAECDAVITGEGHLDRQTLNGKGPHGVARLAGRKGKPVLAVVGGTDDSPEVAEAFDEIVVTRPEDMPLADAMAAGITLLESPGVTDRIRSFLERIG